MYRQAVLRGDPGFLSSAFRGVKGAVTGAVRSLVTGGSPITGAISGAGAALRPGTALAVAPQFSIAPGGQVPRVLTGVGGGQVPAVVGMSPLGTLGISPASQWRGYHSNRSSYYTAGGRVLKGTRMVRNRHTNYGNGRALARALKRAHGFQHLARAVMSFTLTGKTYSRPHFKAKRKSRK
jgi:hypothetical protein